jgi:methanogenic corrinoid protein MtbC1
VVDEPNRHPIRVAARRAGLTAHVLRAWEARYGVVEPERSAGGRRLYSDADIERLRLLHRGVTAGRRIGDLVGYNTEALRALVAEDLEQAEPGTTLPKRRTSDPAADQCVARCLDAVTATDAARFEAEVQRAAVRFGVVELAEDVLSRVMHEVGRKWHMGELTPAQEHMATAVLHAARGHPAFPTLPLSGAPSMVVATPAGQRHEIGAALAAMVAGGYGWSVTYLGADLPAEALAAAVRQVGASVLALSIVYPVNDPDLPGELEHLRRRLPADILLILGGAGASAYQDVLSRIAATVVGDMHEFSAQLHEVGRTAGSPGGTSHLA